MKVKTQIIIFFLFFFFVASGVGCHSNKAENNKKNLSVTGLQPVASPYISVGGTVQVVDK